ncbi:MAG: GHMP kinase [Planctomycetota bacterium]|nr:GHMP kinase [Planctomycetota bacterium]
MSNKGKKVELFVPGRVCLFGEHSDWAAEYGFHRGFCLVIGTDQGLSAVASPSDEFVVETLLPDNLGRPSGRSRRMNCRWDEKTLLATARDNDEFFRYCAGTAHEMSKLAGVTGGIDLQITGMDLPLKKGVSSSAAVCILVAEAFDAVYRLGLFPHELMELAYLGEKLTGSQCGRMDQACIYGKTPVLLTFAKSADIRVEPLFPQKDIYMFLVDLAGRKDTVRILADLQSALPKNKQLQKALGENNERFVRQAYHSLSAGDAAKLGKSMTAAQKNFDESVAPNSPEQLASPLLHELLGMGEIAEHIHGGKGVGSQGDGTAQFVARGAEDRDAAMKKISAAHPKMQCFPLTITAAVQNQRAAHQEQGERT